ncbi:Bifunctional inhibitor/lipid-transfer protein/seed storage 2S albumin superfamily protein [Rhynchospora pubera]|uniref:Bifunctional inhibitor/lipid-transfer protein/seed storage 2S albumin superfamily protein n=1 Tax=Rhynchospora pubera TaxID=906938 RepID=A0AAV8G844_9POAL|nr:Bifunctional inhibitor/lipid-transfer protein/seed storage 2S albumin superfamily protein [Rhynchospora pubera]
MSDESPDRIRHKVPPGMKIPGVFKRLLVFCGPYIQAGGGEMEPNEFCCDGIKKNMSPGICEFVPPFVEQIVSMKKLVYVADKCGLPLAPGTKCGSYTVPPSPLSLGA